MSKRILLIVVSLLISQSLFSQVALYPTAAFIDPQSRTGSMQVINTANDTREIELSVKFGYYSTDSLGNAFTQYSDSIAEKEFSLEPYLKIFPKKMMIPPREQQTVRFMVTGLPENKDQFYWVRIVAASIPQAQQVDSVEKGKVKATLLIRTEMIGLVAMLKGKNTSSLDCEYKSSYSDSANYNFLINTIKTGNSPFWGSMTTQLFDDKNEKVDETFEGLSVYFTSLKKVSFKKDKLKPGKYTLKVFVNNEREEVPAEYRPKFNSLVKQFNVTVN